MNKEKIPGSRLPYEEFSQKLQAVLSRKLAAGISVQVYSMLKNNSLYMDGLVFRQEGACISPIYYLQGYYDRYCQGEEVTDLAWEMIESWQQNNYIPELSGMENFLNDFEKWKNTIVFRLVSRDRNQELLKEIPYIPFLDLAITFHCLVYKDGEGIGSLRVTTPLVEQWGMDNCRLMKLALTNTPHFFPEKLLPITDLLRELLFVPDSHIVSLPLEEPFPEDWNEPLAVTNDSGINGAAVILYPGFLAKMAEQLQDDLYLLPSSIHEMLVVKKEGEYDLQGLSSMVREVNGSCVSPDEILSDQVYLYERKGARVTLASQESFREEDFLQELEEKQAGYKGM